MNSNKLPKTECPNCQSVFDPTEHNDLITKLVDENNQMRKGLLDIEQHPLEEEKTPRELRRIASTALRTKEVALNQSRNLWQFFEDCWSEAYPDLKETFDRNKEYRKIVNEKEKHTKEVYGIGFEKKLASSKINDSLLEENTRLREALEKITSFKESDFLSHWASEYDLLKIAREALEEK